MQGLILFLSAFFDLAAAIYMRSLKINENIARRLARIYFQTCLWLVVILKEMYKADKNSDF